MGREQRAGALLRPGIWRCWCGARTRLPLELVNVCAAFGGHLAVLRWAREHDFPWGAESCARAAINGHPRVLTWAREHNCPWDERSRHYAAEGGHLEVLM